MNEIDQTLRLKCKAKTGEDFCNIHQVDEALRHCTTYLTETTMQSLQDSKLSKQQKTNFVFAIDTVKMAQLHLKLNRAATWTHTTLVVSSKAVASEVNLGTISTNQRVH